MADGVVNTVSGSTGKTVIGPIILAWQDLQGRVFKPNAKPNQAIRKVLSPRERLALQQLQHSKLLRHAIRSTSSKTS